MNSSSTGSIIGSNTLRVITELEEADLLAGKWYINVHTSLNSPGEIRGNLVVVPEPGTMALAAMGLGVLGLAARRRMAR